MQKQLILGAHIVRNMQIIQPKIANQLDDLEEANVEDEDLGTDLLPDVTDNPFDPTKVDVSITTPNLGSLIERLRHNEIDLLPDFQRSADLWSPQQQSRLIESILIRLPIPAFYFDVISDEKWQVVDGLQRLSAIKNFVIDNNLALTKLEFLTEFNGAHFDQLPRSLQRRIDEFQTSVYLIKPGTPGVMKYSLFNRINTGGLKLTPQEIRHAMSQSVRSGAVSKLLRKTVNETIFRKIVKGKNNRMAHQELVLRHFAFRIFGYKEYKSSLPRFLDQAMIKLGELNEETLLKLQNDFISALRLAYDVFEEDVFKKSLVEPSMIKMVNKPLFEALSVNLASIQEEERDEIRLYAHQFRNEFKVLLLDEQFTNSISRSTANTENVSIRFSRIKTLIDEFLQELL